MKALLVDPSDFSIEEVLLADGYESIAANLDCESIDRLPVGRGDRLYFDATMSCERPFASDCTRFPGPYLKLDHVQRHIHGKSLIVGFDAEHRKHRSVHARTLQDFVHHAGVWVPARGLYRNCWGKGLPGGIKESSGQQGDTDRLRHGTTRESQS